MSTPFHTKFFAHELTRRWASDSPGKLSQSINNATIDLNPHQIDAALFAFRSPLSRGALLADEVGLGKTIEAGLVMSQLWAERKRRILCILPAALRQQWERELSEKFFIDSLVMESASYKALVAQGQANPFEQRDKAILCSYEFARRQAESIHAIPWDLVVIDEAHRLRNVYKTGNKIARAIRDMIGHRPKILLTATPLQNSLMELYGLISFIDPHLFGSDESFREQFAKRSVGEGNGELAALRKRILPVCQRTLRRQVQEQIRYTNRVSLTRDFTPTDEEWRLYEMVSTYLQQPQSFALPVGQRALITLVLRKILASSSFAIGATLGKLIERLEAKRGQLGPDEDGGNSLKEEYEALAETKEEWDEIPPNANPETDPPSNPNAEALAAIEQELEDLRSFKKLAETITRNAKGDALLVALKAGFQSATSLGAERKALIFTESRRTQTYLKDLLTNNGYAGKVVVFNGTNNDPESKAVHQAWLSRHEGQDCITGSKSADVRSALVEEFRDRASIMIATESGAEGINLQFCNLVVNYDLPWNPQRIEQRIGRCHRYGQKYDVVVINFINQRNAADRRVFELLDKKFRLFEGIFGASDQVLGALESGVDFERRVNDIYQTCRSTEEINAAFDSLQQELELQIQSRLDKAKSQLLEHFDAEVHERLRLSQDDTEKRRSRFHLLLWWLTKGELQGHADFKSDEALEFDLKALPASISGDGIPTGAYALLPIQATGAIHYYRIGHPLAERLMAAALERRLEPRAVRFNYDPGERRISVVGELGGSSGWLRLSLASIQSLEPEDHLVFSAVKDDGQTLHHETCAKLFEVPGEDVGPVDIPSDIEARLTEAIQREVHEIRTATDSRNRNFFESEIEKMDDWAADLKDGLESELRELQRQIAAAKREARRAADLESKLALHRKVSEVERKRNDKRKRIFEAQDQIDAKKDDLLSQVEERMKLKFTDKQLFTIRWEVQAIL
ncbi:MAG: SNF2-related protein [Elusimicrobiota bacterium]